MEQRSSKRVRRECLVRYRKKRLFLLEGGDIQAELLDISMTGARIKSYATLLPRERITIVIPAPEAQEGTNGNLRVTGDILWVRPQGGKTIKVNLAGVHFSRLSGEAEKFLHAFIHKDSPEAE